MNQTSSIVRSDEKVTGYSEHRGSAPTASAPAARRSFTRWLFQAAPTVLVFAMLGGLALWGHETGWKVPKFSELIGGAEDRKDDWCDEHAVPESVCVECKDELLPHLKSIWCRKHGVHYCPFERPEVAQLKTLPTITQADLDRAQRALDLKERPENNPKCKICNRRLQLASAEMMDKMGVEVAPVWRAPIVEAVAASGELQFKGHRVAPVYTPVAGRVWHVTDKGQIGQSVKRGEVLALMDAAEVGKAKAEFLHAVAQLDLKTKAYEINKSLVPSGVVSQATFNEMEAARREAQIRVLSAQQTLVNLGLTVALDELRNLPPEELSRRLQFLGVPPEFTSRLDAKMISANLYPVLATRDGIVTTAKVVAGEVADTTKPLFVITDTSRMWVTLSIRNEDVPYLRIRDAETGANGQTVKFRPDGTSVAISGELVWKSTQVDEKTRSLQVRAEVPNPKGLLLANMFGVGQVVLREEKDAIVVPSESVLWEGDCNIVFVRDKNFLSPGAPKVFHVRTVRTGVSSGGSTEIIAGLLPGEVIATKNSASLRAELLKNNLGAG